MAMEESWSSRPRRRHGARHVLGGGVAPGRGPQRLPGAPPAGLGPLHRLCGDGAARVRTPRCARSRRRGRPTWPTPSCAGGAGSSPRRATPESPRSWPAARQSWPRATPRSASRATSPSRRRVTRSWPRPSIRAARGRPEQARPAAALRRPGVGVHLHPAAVSRAAVRVGVARSLGGRGRAAASTYHGPRGDPSSCRGSPPPPDALIFDEQGRLLVVNPTYKAHWTIPGGIMEADGEIALGGLPPRGPRRGRARVDRGRLVAVDFLRPKPSKPGGMRFLFDCGVLADATSCGRSRSRRRSSPSTAWSSRPRRSNCSVVRCGAGWARRWPPTTASTSRTVARSDRRRRQDEAGPSPSGAAREKNVADRPRCPMRRRGTRPRRHGSQGPRRRAPPPNMDTSEVARFPAFGLVPPASVESAASPVSVVVSTVVVMSGTPRRRTATLRAPMAKANSAITV